MKRILMNFICRDIRQREKIKSMLKTCRLLSGNRSVDILEAALYDFIEKRRIEIALNMR